MYGPGSQNPKMAEVDKDCWVHPVQMLLKEGHPEQRAQVCVRADFEDLQGGDCTASGHLVPVLSHQYS